jgi:hypothetical protein
MDKLTMATEILGGLFKAGTAIYQVIAAATTADEVTALASLDAALAEVAPLATGLREAIAKNRAEALKDLDEKFPALSPTVITSALDAPPCEPCEEEKKEEPAPLPGVPDPDNVPC